MMQNKKQYIPVIGITGGVGSGKTYVMNILKDEFHGVLIVADEVGHDLMEPGEVSYNRILEHFGEDILEDASSDKGNGESAGPTDGLRQIDRKKLGAIVFSDDSELKVLNDITHGAIREEIQRRIQEYRRKGDHPFIAFEAALLIEGGYEDITDQLWYVYVRPEERIRRLMKGRDYTEEKCRQIMSQQLPDEVFFAHADVVIDNNETTDKINRQIRQALEEAGVSTGTN